MAHHTQAHHIWHYNPSLAGNTIFIVVFFCLTAAHLWCAIRYRARFLTALIVGGVFEIIGYSARDAARSDLGSVMAYAIQSLFLLLAPVLFAATCYMTLGRTVRATKAEHHSVVSLRWLTKGFVMSDVVCFCVQASGGSLQAITSSTTLPKIGKWVVVAGLVLQILSFGCYDAVAITFHRRLRARPTLESMDPTNPWRRVMQTIYAASALIVLRNVIRVVEYAQGFDGWISTHEWMLFAFDAVPMTMLLCILLVWHPGRLLRDRLENLPIEKTTDTGEYPLTENAGQC